MQTVYTKNAREKTNEKTIRRRSASDKNHRFLAIRSSGIFKIMLVAYTQTGYIAIDLGYIQVKQPLQTNKAVTISDFNKFRTNLLI